MQIGVMICVDISQRSYYYSIIQAFVAEMRIYAYCTRERAVVEKVYSQMSAFLLSTLYS